jgi:hypothetical protein
LDRGPMAFGMELSLRCSFTARIFICIFVIA